MRQALPLVVGQNAGVQLLGVHHVAIGVRDLDAALAFYTGTLGFEPIDRPDFGFPGAWLDAGGQQVHLGVTDDDAPGPFQHFALRVDDLDATIGELAAKGVAVSDVNVIDGICRQAFIHDPSGNMIELNQPT